MMSRPLRVDLSELTRQSVAGYPDFLNDVYREVKYVGKAGWAGYHSCCSYGVMLL